MVFVSLCSSFICSLVSHFFPHPFPRMLFISFLYFSLFYSVGVPFLRDRSLICPTQWHIEANDIIILVCTASFTSSSSLPVWSLPTGPEPGAADRSMVSPFQAGRSRSSSRRGSFDRMHHRRRRFRVFPVHLRRLFPLLLLLLPFSLSAQTRSKICVKTPIWGSRIRVFSCSLHGRWWSRGFILP